MKLISKMVAAGATLAIGGLGLILTGCSTPAGDKKANAASAPAQAATPQNGATLWARNCGHCHNTRSPDSYSDAQWEVAALHMRIRANLTAEEHQKILVFLRSAH